MGNPVLCWRGAEALNASLQGPEFPTHRAGCEVIIQSFSGDNSGCQRSLAALV